MEYIGILFVAFIMPMLIIGYVVVTALNVIERIFSGPKTHRKK